MDVIQMPKGHNGYGYILTCLDVATSWLEAWPLRRATADKVSEIIEFQLVPRYGEGLAFIVDQGREFIAHVVKRAVHRTNSYIHYGTVYNSQSNPVERFHRTLEGVIRCLLIDRQQNAKQWPLALQDALRTMRSAPDATTGFSPFFRVFGMQPRISAIEWMNLNREEGGFSFNPEPPNRPIDVEGQHVYPNSRKKTKPLAEGDVKKTPPTEVEVKKTPPEGIPSNQADPEVIEIDDKDEEEIVEDGMHAQVTFNGVTRLLARLPRTRQQEQDNNRLRLYRQIFHLPLPEGLAEDAPQCLYVPVQEDAQKAHDEARKKLHEQNKELRKKRFPKAGTWYPIIGEMVDWREPTDPDNPDTRKMRNFYQGPYMVVNRDIPGKTVTINKANECTLVLEGKQRTVYVGQVRPTLAFEYATRPRGEDFDPDQWMFLAELADYNP